jgi:hypothetical protein
MAMLETQDNLSETEGKEFGCLIQWMKSAVLDAYQDYHMGKPTGAN